MPFLIVVHDACFCLWFLFYFVLFYCDFIFLIWFFNWSRFDLQCCVSYSCRANWFSYTHTHTHTHRHIHTHTHTHTHTYTHIHTRIHTYIHTHTCSYMYTHTYTHTYILLCSFPLWFIIEYWIWFCFCFVGRFICMYVTLLLLFFETLLVGIIWGMNWRWVSLDFAFVSPECLGLSPICKART